MLDLLLCYVSERHLRLMPNSLLLRTCTAQHHHLMMTTKGLYFMKSYHPQNQLLSFLLVASYVIIVSSSLFMVNNNYFDTILFSFIFMHGWVVSKLLVFGKELQQCSGRINL